MKRFESDRTGRLVMVPRNVARGIAQSVDEAKRILAETERPVNWRATGADATWPPDGFMVAHVNTMLVNRRGVDAEIGAALAESLQAFLAMELS